MNRLAELPAGVFSGLSNLQHLDLAQNQLATLPAGVFSSVSSLRDLYLSSNKLAELPAGVFTGLFYLDSLHLDKNQLAQVQADAFADLTRVLVLNLEDNSLTCYYDIWPATTSISPGIEKCPTETEAILAATVMTDTVKSTASLSESGMLCLVPALLVLLCYE
eukprot:128509-Hanusia_phi.AAC.1